MQSAVTPPAEPPSTEYDPYSTSFSRETFDSTISNHRNSLLASQLEPHWSPDTLSACEICNKSFSFRRRRHHCRKCGLLVCYKCSGHKLVVPRFGSTPTRVCDSCFSTVMYNPNTALLGDFEEEDLKAKLLEATVRVAVAATESAKIQSAIQGISVGITGSALGKEVDALGLSLPCDSFSNDDPDIDAHALQSSHPTLLFARNQAHAAFMEYERVRDIAPHFSIAFEEGLDRLVDGTNDFFTWVVIYNGKEFGCSRTQSFLLPPSIMTHLESTGMQKKDAEKIIFGSLASLPLEPVSTVSPPKSPSRATILEEKRQGVVSPATPQGAMAHLLHGKVTWTRYLEPSVVLAFLPFQWHELYSVVEI